MAHMATRFVTGLRLGAVAAKAPAASALTPGAPAVATARLLAIPAAQQASAQAEGPEGFAMRAGALAATGGLALLALADEAKADEAEHGLHSAQYPWRHNGILSSYDHAAIRRGHQVYQQVCAACHSVGRLYYRDLVGVAYTEEEVKMAIEEVEITDGPDDTGEMFERPAKLSDPLPRPYSNEAHARYANGADFNFAPQAAAR